MAITSARRRAGLTLPELLVVAVIFVFLLAVIAQCERMARVNQEKVGADSDTYRMAMVTLERIKTQVRGALILSVGKGGRPEADKLTYKLPRLAPTGEPDLDSFGHPIWTPEGSGAFTLTLDEEGWLVGADGRRLSPLGPRGELHFQLPSLSGFDLVEVSVHAELDPSSHRVPSQAYDAKVQLYFPNQN